MSINDIPVRPVQTRHRHIQSKELLTPEMLNLLEEVHRFEPLAMQGQPPIVWDRAEGFYVYDRHGNKWLDFSSGVLVTNAGHGRKEIADAIIEQTRRGLLHSYVFLNEPRIKLARKLCELAPEPLKKAFLLSTGSETTECAVKLSRTHGRKVSGNKNLLVSFTHGFHGRTLGTEQLIGGIPALKEWIGPYEVGFVQVPFPDGFRCEDQSFDCFERTLAAANVTPDQIAGVITETYQGGGASFAPPAYIRDLRDWCTRHQVILTFDEVQAGFGRCGKMWGFEHYGVVPDLMCLGKGISSSLPIAALVGRPDLMDMYPPGSMTSTHSGSPVCAAAALANIDLILKEKLVENAARCGEALHRELWRQLKPFDARIGAIHGKGLVAGVHCIKDDSTAPDRDLAFKAVWNCVGRGLMLFSPVGVNSGTIKICPPLCITEDAVVEGVSVIAESLAKALSA